MNNKKIIDALRNKIKHLTPVEWAEITVF